MNISKFMNTNFRHFNAAAAAEAAKGFVSHLESGGKMFLAMAGAMSTGEIGKLLAEMIRRDKIQGVSCTAANLEEDIFNLVAHNHYERIPDYRGLSPEQEVRLRERGLNRVTDTCIPEEEAIRRMEAEMLELWQQADGNGQSFFPYEYFYKLLESKKLERYFEIDPKDSWVVAAAQKQMPIFTPGWEDSTLGNIFVANVIRKRVSRFSVVKSGLEQMGMLVEWYKKATFHSPLGFFQIGGGIAGDFPICVVPLIRQDLQEDCRLWGYFCQISDSTTSYGSYSGAVPNEKISWGKLGIDTPKYVVESDASIVAPLIFQYVLENS